MKTSWQFSCVSAPRVRRVAAAAFGLLTLAAVGCTVPVAAGVGEGDANRIVVALDHASIDATKEADPTAEGRFRVAVSRDDVARSLAAMSAEGLPRPDPAGVLSSVDKGALVPSRASERAQVVAGLAGDLERTLESIDGILSARVHLSMPENDPLRDPGDVGAPRSTASVLLEHRAAAPPLPTSEVQRLVAGGVAGLSPVDVAVVTIQRAAAVPSADGMALVHVGPIAVARTSARLLQVALGALLALVAALAFVTLGLYARLSRARAEHPGHAGTGSAT